MAEEDLKYQIKEGCRINSYETVDSETPCKRKALDQSIDLGKDTCIKVKTA